jgi:hypothetical protein
MAKKEIEAEIREIQESIKQGKMSKPAKSPDR